MPAQVSSFRRSIVPALLIAATFALTFALRYPSFFEPRWYGDEGIFASVASNLRHGHKLYSAAWDNKPPLIYFTYAAIQSLFGTGEMPLHIVATIVVLFAQAAVVAAACLLFGRWRAAGAGAVFALLLGTPVIEGNLAMTETFMILPTSLAALLFVWRERRGSASPGALAVIGALIGVAAAYKQVAVFDGLAIAVMVRFTHQRALRDLTAMAAGFAVPQGALALLFLATGAFGAYWYAVVGSLGLYADMAPPVSGLKKLGELLPPLIVVFWLLREQRRGQRIDAAHFPVVWLAFAFAGVIASSFAFPHYLVQGVPALALAAASVRLAPAPVRDLPGRLALGAAALLIALVIHAQFWTALRTRTQLAPRWYYGGFISRQSGDISVAEYDARFDGGVPVLASLSAMLRQDAAGTTAFDWSDQAWLYAQAGLTNPSRYFTSYLGTKIPGARGEIIRDLDRQPPAYVVISEHAFSPFAELEAFVAGRYTLLAQQQGEWRLYRLAGARGKLTPEQAQALIGGG